MPRWEDHIELGDLFARFHDGDDFEPIRDGIAARLRASWMHGHDEALRLLADEVADCVTVEDFDALWRDVYDWADRERVWLCTTSRTQACPPLPTTTTTTELEAAV